MVGSTAASTTADSPMPSVTSAGSQPTTTVGGSVPPSPRRVANTDAGSIAWLSTVPTAANSVASTSSNDTVPGGAPFSGGYATETPFGIIHSTNITPEPETGIGTWSEAAFARAFKRETGMPPGAVRRLPDSLATFA